jgi:UDP-N-acetylmuramate-alanine ligase
MASGAPSKESTRFDNICNETIKLINEYKEGNLSDVAVVVLKKQITAKIVEYKELKYRKFKNYAYEDQHKAIMGQAESIVGYSSSL